jgi:splicing factor 3B subunit 4
MAMLISSLADRGNQEATVWVGGLEPQATEELVWELMLQCGPVVNVNMPRDKITNTHQGYAFCEFRTPDDAEYSTRIMNNVRLHGKPIRVNKASKNVQTQEYSANLFIGNLDPEVDEKSLLDTFSMFGHVISTKVMADEGGAPRGFGFVTFDTFEAADEAIRAMNNQYLANKQISVSYAFKKDGSKGDRHGSEAERKIAAAAQKKQMLVRPPPLPTFPGIPGMRPPMPMYGQPFPPVSAATALFGVRPPPLPGYMQSPGGMPPMPPQMAYPPNMLQNFPPGPPRPPQYPPAPPMYPSY